MKIKGGTSQISDRCTLMFNNPAQFGLEQNAFSDLNLTVLENNQVGGKKKVTKKKVTKKKVTTKKTTTKKTTTKKVTNKKVTNKKVTKKKVTKKTK